MYIITICFKAPKKIHLIIPIAYILTHLGSYAFSFLLYLFVITIYSKVIKESLTYLA